MRSTRRFVQPTDARRKALEPDRLPFGVLVMDGKGTALGGCDDFYAQRQSQDDGMGFTLSPPHGHVHAR